MDDLRIFNSIRINSFDASDSIFKNGSKLIRYHYTSPETFIKILKGDKDKAQLRFTDIRYMNDKSESVIVAKALFEFLDLNMGSYKKSRMLANELLLSNYSEDDYINLRATHIDFTEIPNLPFEKTRHFVFCMSKGKDSLHMWNYYTKGGNYQGYNIGFDVYKFIKSFDSGNNLQADMVSIRYGDVIYNKEKQHNGIKLLLDKIENNNIEKTHNLAFLRSGLEMLAPFFKDSSYSSEEEYRVVFSIGDHLVRRTEEANQYRNKYFNENLRKMRFDYFERNGVLVPYMQVPVIKEAVKSVYIAPMVEEEIARDSLEEFLYVNNYSAVNIYKSAVPIRF